MLFAFEPISVTIRHCENCLNNIDERLSECKTSHTHTQETVPKIECTGIFFPLFLFFINGSRVGSEYLKNSIARLALDDEWSNAFRPTELQIK